MVGITASLAREVGADSDLLVLAFDILLADLFHEIQRMAPSANSRVFIFREDAQVYVPGDGRQPSDFRDVPALSDPVVRKMVDAWGERHLPSGEAFALVDEGGAWWCGFRAMEDTHRNVWVGVMVPEADITGGVVRRRAGLWTAGGLVMLLAGGLAVFMIRRYGRPFEASEGPYDRRQPVASIRRLIDQGEGRSIEFKSTMRMNLHTGKPVQGDRNRLAQGRGGLYEYGGRHPAARCVGRWGHPGAGERWIRQ